MTRPCEYEFDHEESLRRLAIQMAAQLPPGRSDTESVLRQIRHIVDRFMFPAPHSLQVVLTKRAVVDAANDARKQPAAPSSFA